MSLLIYGAGGHAAVVAEIATLRGIHVAAFAVDERWYVPRLDVCGPPYVIGDDATLTDMMSNGVSQAFVAIGDCVARSAITERLSILGFDLVPLIHPAATVSATAEIGRGTVVCAGGVVCPRAKLGDGVIVNTLASIDHDCEVRSYVHISPGARLAGGVKVGSCTWVGTGAAIIDRLNIGGWSVIGAGAVVTRDLPEKVVAYGVPARIKRSTDPRLPLPLMIQASDGQ